MLRQAGLDNVEVNPIIHAYPPGHGRRYIYSEFAENLTERWLEQTMIGESELTNLKADLRLHLDDPGTLVTGLYFQAWGRAPG